MATLKPTKILIATTNLGKFNELVLEFQDLPFTFINLADCGLASVEADEPFGTTEQNAIHKARFYAQKSGLTTIAEDSGLFVKYLKGEPGVHAKRYAPTDRERIQKILAALRGVPLNKRQAWFESTSCLYDPKTDSFTVFVGKTTGHITEKPSRTKARPGLEYDAVFYYDEAKKIGTALTTEEKNLISHRGKVANQIKIFLLKQLSFKQLIVPTALIIKDGKIFVNRRRDHRPSFNNKWELPGGGVEEGESVTDCLLREVKEETGFTVTIKDLIPRIFNTGVSTNGSDGSNYQVFILCYICSIKSGQLTVPKNESNGHGWFTLAEAKKLDFLPLNKKMFRRKECLEIIKKYVE